MSIASIGKTVGTFENNIMTCIKDGVDLRINQNTTNADIANWEAQCNDIFKSGFQGISNEAYSQMQEGATNHLIDRGFSKEEAERITRDTLKRITGLAENIRKELPTVERTIKLGWVKFVGVVTIGFAGLTTFSMFSRDPQTDDARKEVAFLKHTQQEQKIAIDSLSMNVMISGLVTAPSAPQEAPPMAAAPMAYVPPAVAAIAAQPATATITTQGSTQTVQTTVGQIYRYAPPPVRRFMAPPSPPPEEEEDPSGDYHESFTVDSGFASISISY